MIRLKSVARRTSYAGVAALFLLAAVAVALPTRKASALGLLYRSLQTSSSVSSSASPIGQGGDVAAAGTGANGQQVSHTYIFEVRTTGSINNVHIQYCDSAFGYLSFAPDSIGTCGAISGFASSHVTTATVYKAADLATVQTASTGGSAFSRNATLSTGENELDLKQSGGALSVTAGDYVKVVVDATGGSSYFVNPDDSYANGTYFAHIETYSSDANVDVNPPVDEGTVTTSTANVVSINTRVQETLNFSVGGQDGAGSTSTSAPANDPQAVGTCDALDTTGALSMGDANQALSATAASHAKSYFRIATNASKGAKVLYAGQTLKSTAGDIIAAAGAAATDAPAGTPLFGMRVLASDSVNHIGYTNLTPAAAYQDATPTKYAFDTTSNTAPVTIASSTGVISCDTMGVDYIGNISNDTPAGLYSTKVAFIAVPTY